jgi:4-hydroxy-tetrahydrodipicolinate reductase
LTFYQRTKLALTFRQLKYGFSLAFLPTQPILGDGTRLATFGLVKPIAFAEAVARKRWERHVFGSRNVISANGSILRIGQFGVGSIGIESIRLAASKPWAEVVGAVDVDPAKIGRSLAELTGLDELSDRYVYGSFRELWEKTDLQAILHTAGSSAETSINEIIPMARHGLTVASSCEQLLFPQLRAAEASNRLDSMCKAYGARVVGTGVNPGFVMDVLPICLSGITTNVQSVFAERVVNASTRRKPLQQKIGSGMRPEEFRQRFAAGAAGHAGFRESAALIAHCLGWTIDEMLETCEPVIAERPLVTAHFDVPPGMTCGLHQRVVVRSQGEQRIELDLKMYLDAEDPHDTVRIDGDPPVEALVKGGVAGDQATVAALVNSLPRLLRSSPGLHLMTDLPVPSWA